MNPMTERSLTIWLADEFHDWIDGDDYVANFRRPFDNVIEVEFESGARFKITINGVN